MTFPFAIVGFDLDGTLLDTGDDLAAAVNHALVSDGRAPLAVERIRPMIGGGGRHMFAQALAAIGGCDAAALDTLYPRMLAYYEAHIAVHTRAFPGAIEAVDTLRALGVRCAIVTNKRASFAEALLFQLGLRERFTCVIGGDTLGPGREKPAPDPVLAMIARCGGGPAAFVGDSIYDVTAARAAGVPVVACAFGFLQQPVESLGADAIIEHYAELIPALEARG